MGYGFGKLNDYADRCNSYAIKQGFWFKRTPKDVKEVTLPMEKLMLITTEVAEAAEALRKGDSANFAEELADIIIRTLDLAAHFGINIEQEMVNKMLVNEQRPKMHGKKA